MSSFFSFSFSFPSGIPSENEREVARDSISKLIYFDHLLVYLVCQDVCSVPSCPLLMLIFKIIWLEWCHFICVTIIRYWPRGLSCLLIILSPWWSDLHLDSKVFWHKILFFVTLTWIKSVSLLRRWKLIGSYF